MPSEEVRAGLLRQWLEQAEEDVRGAELLHQCAELDGAFRRLTAAAALVSPYLTEFRYPSDIPARLSSKRRQLSAPPAKLSSSYSPARRLRKPRRTRGLSVPYAASLGCGAAPRPPTISRSELQPARRP